MTIRVFHIPDGASMADPEHLIKYWEVTDGNTVQYTTFDPLQVFINELILKDVEAQAHQKALKEILGTLGVTFAEYMEAYKAKRQKEKDASISNS